MPSRASGDAIPPPGAALRRPWASRPATGRVGATLRRAGAGAVPGHTGRGVGRGGGHDRKDERQDGGRSEGAQGRSTRLRPGEGRLQRGALFEKAGLRQTVQGERHEVGGLGLRDPSQLAPHLPYEILVVRGPVAARKDEARRAVEAMGVVRRRVIDERFVSERAHDHMRSGAGANGGNLDAHATQSSTRAQPPLVGSGPGSRCRSRRNGCRAAARLVPARRAIRTAQHGSVPGGGRGGALRAAAGVAQIPGHEQPHLRIALGPVLQ